MGVAPPTRYCQKVPLPTVGNEWDCRSISHSVCDRVGNFIGPFELIKISGTESSSTMISPEHTTEVFVGSGFLTRSIEARAAVS